MIPREPESYKLLISEEDRTEPVVWLNADRTELSNLVIDTTYLDPQKLKKISKNDVNWWYYVGAIPPEAIGLVR